MTNLFFDDFNELSWDELPWHEIRLHVLNLQTQIYRATLDKKKDASQKLQEFLLQDYGACLLSLNIVVKSQFIKKK